MLRFVWPGQALGMGGKQSRRLATGCGVHVAVQSDFSKGGMRALKNLANNLARPEQSGRVFQRALKNSAELFGARQIIRRVF